MRKSVFREEGREKGRSRKSSGREALPRSWHIKGAKEPRGVSSDDVTVTEGWTRDTMEKAS